MSKKIRQQNKMITKRNRYYASELKKLRKMSALKRSTLSLQQNLASQQQESDLEKSKKHFTRELVLKIFEVFRVLLFQFKNTETEKH